MRRGASRDCLVQAGEAATPREDTEKDPASCAQRATGSGRRFRVALNVLAASAAAACLTTLSLRHALAPRPPQRLRALGPRITPSAPSPPATSADPVCLGFDSCPRYPRPYGFGEWPMSYERSGAFPDDFAWGLSTAAYQVEGAYREGGRGASIWDTFAGADTVGMPGGNCSYCCKAAPCPANPAMIDKGATGNVASDHYHTLEADVALMKSMGLKHYRFSIAWPRIFPTGRARDGLNEEGKAFYNRLIDALLAAGIEPSVSLYHWDLPQGLLDPPRSQGWWSRDAVTGEPTSQLLPDWLDYVDACFAAFGDRVKLWVTFHEPLAFTWLASGWGRAPGIPDFGNQSSDPYIAAHNVLNAHAAAVELYRFRYQPIQGGRIGITNSGDWREPTSAEPADIAAAERAVEFSLGWLSDPIFGGAGDYPPAMRRMLGDRLPKFTEHQKRILNGSSDFFGLCHHGTRWAAYTPGQPGFDGAYATLAHEGLPRAESPWQFEAGWGLRKLLNWADRRYGHPPIYVSEDGWSPSAATRQAAADWPRVAYFANHTAEMRRAIVEDGVDVRGYFASSLLDGFEWEHGYTEQLGTTYTDLASGPDGSMPAKSRGQPHSPGKQVRRRKTSSCWLEAVWRANALIDPDSTAFEGCVDSIVFAGEYAESSHSGCFRSILVDSAGLTGSITGTGAAINGTRCTGKDDILWGPVPVALHGGTIVADFSKSGGPSSLHGYWNRNARRIDWGDGRSWDSTSEARGEHELVLA